MSAATKLLLALCAMCAVPGCKGEEAKPDPQEKAEPEKRLVTDPAEQLLMLQEAIRRRRASISDLEVKEGTEKDIAKIEKEISILEENLERARRRLRLKTAAERAD